MNEHIHARQRLYGESLDMQVTADARDAQDVLDSEPGLSDEDVSALIDTLNEKWPYHDYRMQLNGEMIIFCDAKIHDQTHRIVSSEGEFITDRVEGFDAYSRGFGVLNRHEYVNGAHARTRREVVYNFLVETDDKTHVNAFAGLNDVEYVIPWPDEQDAFIDALLLLDRETQDIDGRVLSAENEMEALLSLKGMKFSNRKQRKRVLTADEYCGALSAYVDSYITFNKRLPYRATISGECELYLPDEDEWQRLLLEEGSELNCFPSAVSFAESSRSSSVYVPYLRMTVIRSDYTEGLLEVPLSSLDDIKWMGDEMLMGDRGL